MALEYIKVNGTAQQVNDPRLSDWALQSSKPSYTLDEVGDGSTRKLSNYLLASTKGVANGVAELDANGLVPSSQLPSYVDDVLEYANRSSFPSTGESGKIYVALDTNLTYRWTGSTYTEISPSLALGETSSTAYRGDRGATAYSHATDQYRLTTAQSSGFYKFSTTSEGHVGSVTAVSASDLTSLIGNSTYAPYNSAGYLPLSGGTLTGASRTLTLDTTNTLAGIVFKQNSTYKGNISWEQGYGIYLQNKGGNYVNLTEDGEFRYGDSYKFWHAGYDGSGSGLDADLLDGQHGSYYATASDLDYRLFSTHTTSPQDAFYGDSPVSWAETTAEYYKRAFIYNSYGTEWSYLMGMTSDANYGSILKFGYADRYLRILRKNSGSWQTDEWELINAGYADSAGSASSASYATSAGYTLGSAGYVIGTDTGNWDADAPGTSQYLWYYGQAGGVTHFPGTYGSVVTFFSGGTSQSLHAQLAWGINHDSANASHGIWWRAKNNLGWDATWHRLYDDNNHPYADALSTSRSIWGQSFNGTGDINGELKVYRGGSVSTEYLSISAGDSYVDFDFVDPYDHFGDYRFKSDGTTILYVSGGTSRLSVCTSSPSYTLDVNGLSQFRQGIYLTNPTASESWINFCDANGVHNQLDSYSGNFVFLRYASNTWYEDMKIIKRLYKFCFLLYPLRVRSARESMFKRK